MKFLLIIISLLGFSLSGKTQNTLLENKEYSIIIREYCKSFQDGGCLITAYNVLKFEKDSVSIEAYTKADCDSKERDQYYNQRSLLGKFPYQIHKKKGSDNHFIRINGYSFGLLEVFPDYLIELNADHTTNSDHIFNLIK